MAFVVSPLKSFTAESKAKKVKNCIYIKWIPCFFRRKRSSIFVIMTTRRSWRISRRFAEVLRAERYVPPMMVRALADGRIVVIEGHCRRRGVQLAIRRGAKIPLVSVIPFRGNDAERVELMLRSAQGLKLETLDIARGYLRLQQMGFTSADIATSQSRTRHASNNS